MSESERQAAEVERADRSIFVQELLLSSLSQGLRLDHFPPDQPNGPVRQTGEPNHHNMLKHTEEKQADPVPPPSSSNP